MSRVGRVVYLAQAKLAVRKRIAESQLPKSQFTTRTSKSKAKAQIIDKDNLWDCGKSKQSKQMYVTFVKQALANLSEETNMRVSYLIRLITYFCEIRLKVSRVQTSPNSHVNGNMNVH